MSDRPVIKDEDEVPGEDSRTPAAEGEIYANDLHHLNRSRIGAVRQKIKFRGRAARIAIVALTWIGILEMAVLLLARIGSLEDCAILMIPLVVSFALIVLAVLLAAFRTDLGLLQIPHRTVGR